MPTSQEELELLITQLASDEEPVTIHTMNDGCNYRIQRPLLAAASETLADHCDEKHTHLDVYDCPFRIFLGWLLQRTINDAVHEQEELAMAWNFGMEWGIPAFQNAVMHKLVPLLGEQWVAMDAVETAYNTDSRHSDSLRRAFAEQMAIQIHTKNGGEVELQYLDYHGLADDTPFLMALVEAQARLAQSRLVHKDGSWKPKLDVKDFMESEDS